MLDRCKAGSKACCLDPTKFDLKTFRSTYVTRMLVRAWTVQTVRHWMGHTSLETTMRNLVPATDVHGKLDRVKIRGQLKNSPVPQSPSRVKRIHREAGG
jgi:integrase